MATRGEAIGFELLEVTGSVTTLQDLGDFEQATALKVIMNKQGTTGDNVVAFNFVDGAPDPDANNGVQFTDGGGYMELIGKSNIENFKAITLDASTYYLQIFYCNPP